jgi:diguanylate cyclase (GGDEF)-like protein/PAS domain S-box-containing protein
VSSAPPLLTGDNYTSTGLAFMTGFTAVAILLFGVAIFVRARSRASILFLTITIAASGWLAGLAMTAASNDVAVAIFWARAANLFAVLIPSAVLHFAAVYAGRRESLRAPIVVSWIFCGLVALLSVTPLFTPGVHLYTWGYYPRGSSYNTVWALVQGAMLIGAMGVFWKAYRTSAGADRARSRLLAIAFATGSLAFIDYLPTMGIDVYPLGYIPVLAFGVIAATAVWRYALVDFTPEFAAPQILETMKGSVLVADMSGTIRVVNRAACQLLGYKSSELTGLHVRRVIGADDNFSTGQILNSMGVFEQNMVWRDHDGERIDVLASSSFARDANGLPVAVVYVASDYTERKRAEQALRESEHRYRTLFDANPLPMWVYDFETLRFIAVNDAAIAHYGYSREEFLAMTIVDIRPVEDVPRMRAALNALREHSTTRSFRHRRKDGSLIDTEISSFEFISGGRRTRLVIAQDVTERRRAEASLRASEERYRELFENANDVVYTTDLEGAITSINVAGERITGYAPEEVLGTPILNLIAPEDHERARGSLRRELQGEVSRTAYELHFVAKSGHRVPLEVNTRLVVRDGEAVGVQGIARDITDRKANEARFRLLFDRNLAGVFRGTIEGELVECNDALARIFGFESREDFMAQPTGSRYADPEAREKLLAQLRAERTVTNMELEMLRRDGTTVWVLENVSLVEGQSGEADMLEGTIIDITDRRTAQTQMEYQAYHDVLTGLPNRLLFRDRITIALAHARRSRRAVAVMFLDLDQFKLVNDTLGHTVGDGLLQAVASRLVQCVRAEDTVARMGGDEFTVLLADLGDRRAAATVAQKLLDAVRRPVMVDSHELFATTSIGISIFPEDGADAETLLKNADRAMYRAKEVGRNNYQHATPSSFDTSAGRLALERSLHHAFERNEFVLHYQPMVEIASNRLVGAEALVRWNHPEHGLMMPDEFIPVAEECQLIVPLGEWVLRTACTQMKTWHDAGHGPLRVAVNLSPRQFQQRDLAAMVERVLAETGLAPEHLDLEITETAAMQNIDLSLQVMHRLKEMGVHISIDDFGTGYSSLSYLKRFPIDTVKIDQDFVRDLSRDASDAAIITAVISMARALKLRVIAEGVETEEQLAFLQREQCAEMQGYLYSHPLPAGEFEEHLGAVIAR